MEEAILLNEYTGRLEEILFQKEMAEIYEGKLKPRDLDMIQNQYLYMLDNEDCSLIDKLRVDGDNFVPLKYHYISNEYMGTLKPRNTEQELAFDLLQNPNITVKLITGRFGSGKTFIMLGHALSMIEKNKVDKIVYVRNNIEVKNSNPLGALPGEMYDKLLPYAKPIADHVGGIDGLQMLMSPPEPKLEIEHLGFMRGRDIKNSILFVSEAENLTKEHVQLLIGRVGEGSQIWFDGDFKQTDKEVFEKYSGLKIMIERLKGNKLFGYVRLKKSERSKTAQLADLLD